MTSLLAPGSGILFMKVGTHANEPLAEIIKRKSKEIEEAGYSLWGYGGNTCHPQTMVQPFARAFEESGSTITLCMHEMESHHYAEQIRADEFSVDGVNWERIPASINVLGSRHALVITDLVGADFELPLDHTKVAVGNSRGRIGSQYIQGRVDKGCFEVVGSPVPSNQPSKSLHIGLTAKLIKPYAVFLRNKPA